MWFITGIQIQNNRCQEKRCFGYFTTFNRAIEAVKENRGGLDDCFYNYLVLEEFGEGVFACCEKEIWLKWGANSDKWFECAKPEEVEHVVSFGIG